MEGYLANMRPLDLDHGVSATKYTPILGPPAAKPLAINMAKGRATTIMMLPAKNHQSSLTTRDTSPDERIEMITYVGV
jgi:hypothetical protein